MQRRDVLTSLSAFTASVFTASLFAATPLRAASASRRYSLRAVDLVAESNVIDMLGLPTLNWALFDRWQQVPAAFTDGDFRKLRASGINVFHPAVAFETPRSHAVTLEWFGKWDRLMNAHPNYFVRVDCSGGLARAKSEGKIGIILGMQDSNHFRCPEDVDAFYRIGQRLTQLTYNDANQAGDGCKAILDKGLTAFGGELVTRMNSIGMAIDISHCGQRTSLDAISLSKKPVLITHSNCRALAPGACPHTEA